MINIKNLILITLWFSLMMILLFPPKIKEPIIIKEEPIILEEPELAPPEIIKDIEPNWTNWSKVREENNPRYGSVLNDIESHMPKNHIYRDSNLVTSSHETTHGINSNIRNKHQKSNRINAFYCLDDKACIIEEPKIQISDIARVIPDNLRGPSYELYLVKSTKDWNNDSLYLFDEWSAYTNGSLTGLELNYENYQYELLQAHNFNVYCTYLAKVVKERCPDYDDTQLKSFLMWNTQRVFGISYTEAIKVMAPSPEDKEFESNINRNLYPKSDDWYGGNYYGIDEYLKQIRSAPESEGFRKFCREYFGEEWCKRVYEF